MDSHTLLTLWILSAIGLCSCQNEVQLDGPLKASVGGSVVFKLTNPPSPSPTRITWFSPKGEEMVHSSNEVIQNVHPAYVGRISLNTTTASLELSNLTSKDNGEYSVTLTSNSLGYLGRTSLTVFVGVSGPNITHSDEVLIAGRSSVNLTCNAAQGSNITREWTKDGSPLSSSNNVIISEDKATVSISPVEKGDRGEYKCKLSNPVSAAEATIMLNVNYGPEQPHVNGENVIKIGSPIHLTCTAESIPESTYKWTFEEEETSGASYSKDQSEYKDSGNYTCRASNSITGITSTAVFELSVVEEVTSGLTTGAIVGIAVGVIFAILIAGIGLALFLKKKGKLGAPKRHQAPDQRPNGSVELNYADISQFQKKDGQKVNVGSSEAAGPQSKQFSNKGFGLRATAGNRANTGDQSTEYAAAKPKGQASGPPYQAEDVTYAQVMK